MKIRFIFILFFTLLASTVSLAQEADSEKQMDTIEALIQVLQEKGVLTDEEAQGFLQRYRTSGDAQEKQVLTIIPQETQQELLQTITEDVNREMGQVEIRIDQTNEEMMRRSRIADKRIEQLENKVTGEIGDQLYKSSWAQRIRFGGDVRLRYQEDNFEDTNAILRNPADTTMVLNTTEDRQRGRIRIRLAAKAKIIDPREKNVGKLEAAVRIATGNEKDPVSTNDTLGDYMNKDGVVLDRAYLKWSWIPENPVGKRFPEIAVLGGRIPNPFYSTDLVWDSDLNFEGLALTFRTDTDTSNKIRGFMSAGAFPLQEEEFSNRDKWLLGGQVGVEFQPKFSQAFTLAAAYYDYINIEGVVNSPFFPGLNDFTSPISQQKGNTLINIDPTGGIRTALAADYDLLNITAKADISTFYPIHIILQGDYVWNLGFDRNEVARRTMDPEQGEDTVGYQAGLTVGHSELRAFGDWNISLFYKHLEKDAVIDAFTDSDFHLGGTNAQGWSLAGAYTIYNNLWLKARWISTDEIEGPPLAVDTLQFDLNARY